MPVAASTPGKLILLGEHAVVYGQPALVAAVDLRCTVTAHLRSDTEGGGDTEGTGAGGTATSSNTVEIELPQLDFHDAFPWDHCHAYAADARRRWRQYADDPSPRAFARVRGDDPAHLVKVALGEALEHARRRRGAVAPPDLHLKLDSRLPIGSGFGSSAALALALLAVLTKTLDADASRDELEALALEVERRQHGMPSGVDGATVLHGGVVWAERAGDRPDAKLTTRPLDVSSPHLSLFRVIDTGTPAETTGAVVAEVRQRLDGDPSLHRHVEGLGELTRRLRDELTREDGELETLLSIVRSASRHLEALGVVPEPVIAVVRRVEEAGGAAKISGAGALTSPAAKDPEAPLGAGSLLVLHPRPEALSGVLGDLRPLPLRLGAEGLRLGG